MYMLVAIVFANSFHTWKKLTTVAVLCQHPDVGKDSEPNLWLHYGNAVGLGCELPRNYHHYYGNYRDSRVLGRETSNGR